MSIAETVLEKLNALPPEKQEQVLNYVESISQQVKSFPKTGTQYAFLDMALNAGIQGPPDWSEHLDDYLHGDRKNGL
jgi:hypothetical protein